MKINPRASIAKIRPYVPGRPIREVVRELGMKDVIKLASNENALGPSPKALKAVKSYLDEIHRYPDGELVRELKESLAGSLGVDSQEIVLGNGSNEILELVTRAFVEPQDEILTSESTFLVYEALVHVAGARGRFVPLKDYRYDLDSIAGQISEKAKVIFISNPNNPTGTALDRDEVNDFLRKVPERVLVVFDEAYYDFSELKTFPDLMRDRRPNVVVVRTFSKSYGLAGLRIGYGVAMREIARSMNKVRQPFNVNSLALVAARAALEDTDHLTATRKMVEKGRAALEKSFQALGVSYVRSAANFVLFTLPLPSKQAAAAFLKQGVIVREMDAYGLKRALRVTVGTEAENKRFVKALETVIQLKPRVKERTA
ncbi:MAG: histidinol-phosphate transaminase [Candidatus Omnitrophica bacterium]|nr:histidinol-phosphate transaminase [Candidatus Omnitrophota bacterium]